jgi:hypothetical protein
MSDDNKEISIKFDPVDVLKNAAGSDKVIAGYFDQDGKLNCYVGKDFSYMEILFLADTFTEIGKEQK